MHIIYDFYLCCWINSISPQVNTRPHISPLDYLYKRRLETFCIAWIMSKDDLMGLLLFYFLFFIFFTDPWQYDLFVPSKPMHSNEPHQREHKTLYPGTITSLWMASLLALSSFWNADDVVDNRKHVGYNFTVYNGCYSLQSIYEHVIVTSLVSMCHVILPFNLSINEQPGSLGDRKCAFGEPSDRPFQI